MKQEQKQQALNFLENIESTDKVALIFHDDLDGFASGILLYDYLIKKGCGDIKYYIFSLGKSKLETINLEDRQKIILADLGPNTVAQEINKLAETKQILYIDHHKQDVELSKNIIKYLNEGAIPASRLTYELVGGKYWLSVSGTITDFGDKYQENKDFIEKFFKDNNLDFESTKKNIIYKISYFLIYFEKDYKKAFDILQKVNSIEETKQILKYIQPVEDEDKKFIDDYEKNKEKLGMINYYFFSPQFEIKSVVTTLISIKSNEDIFVFATPHKESIRLSARCQSGKYDMSDLLKSAISGLIGNAGGHSKAAGATIQAKDLEKFKNNLRNLKI